MRLCGDNVKDKLTVSGAMIDELTRDMPDIENINSRHARDCRSKRDPECRKSSTEVNVSRHAQDLIDRTKPELRRSGTKSEGLRHAHPNTEDANIERLRLRGNNSTPMCMRSMSSIAKPRYAELRKGRKTSK